MHGKKRKTAFAALVATGFFAVAPLAHADVTTSGNGSIGGGNQIVADLDAPINICGNAIAILGISGASCSGSGAAVVDPPEKPEPPAECEDSGYGECEPGEPPTEEPPTEEPPGYEEPPTEEPPGGEEPPTEEPPGGGGEEPPGYEPPGGGGEEPPGGGGEPPSENPENPDEPTVPQSSEPGTPENPGTATRLPVTGVQLVALLGMAGSAIVAGAGALFLGRRRRGTSK
ncbi:chaplin family protein [Nocardiopsis ansamitocini]|uniref:DUF320 domain-containing protein n=1 Tax=Nocardiopsis ansamitocini TaxID=1670832 RepID=A0A9W6PBH2_9ACTN|nr:chaplin family protein [Nocardiopsis ansamitocini]GLU50499.1 hypothetical protein Nans01_48500 [Nocardiopsis ansamitocini]